MQRCIETGHAIAKACGVESQAVDELNDIDYGAWQFRSCEEIEKTENLWAHKKRINGVPISHKSQHMQFSLVKISFQHRQKERQHDCCEDE